MKEVICVRDVLGGHTHLTGMCVAPGAHDVLKSQ